MPYKLNKQILDEKYNFIIGKNSYASEYDNIHQFLIKLNFNISSIGFYYWISAIMLYKKYCNNYDNTIENVYEDVAELHNTTRSRVERAMRTAKFTALNEIHKYFKYNNKLTNKVVLELLTFNKRI